VAIIVVGVVAALISPVLVISVATRVNSQKTEQALQIAQAEIDSVRGVVERGRLTADDVDDVLPPSTPFTGDAVEDVVNGSQSFTVEYPQAIAGPVGNSYVENGSYTDLDNAFDARSVDIDGDGAADFVVQAFRSPGQLDGDAIPIAFSMGVRVYDIRAFQTGNANNLPVEEARAGVISTEGDRSNLPLAVLYTTVAKADIANSYCDYIRYLGSTPSSVYVCD
jgi:type II secretory pathway pseudopilin PulG